MHCSSNLSYKRRQSEPPAVRSAPGRSRALRGPFPARGPSPHVREGHGAFPRWPPAAGSPSAPPRALLPGRGSLCWATGPRDVT